MPEDPALQAAAALIAAGIRVEPVGEEAEEKEFELDMEMEMTTPGPNELELREVLQSKIENDGLLNIHISWGPEAAEMTPEERYRYVIDHVIDRDTSKDVLVTAAEIDRAALAPEVFPATWEAMTRIERRREITRVAKMRAGAATE